MDRVHKLLEILRTTLEIFLFGGGLICLWRVYVLYLAPMPGVK